MNAFSLHLWKHLKVNFAGDDSVNLVLQLIKFYIFYFTLNQVVLIRTSYVKDMSLPQVLHCSLLCIWNENEVTYMRGGP